MTSSSRVRRTLAALLLPLSLGLTACGGDGATGTDDPTTSASADAGADGGSEEVEVAEFVALLSEGLESGGEAHLMMEVEGGAQAITAEGDIDYDSTPPAMMLDMTLAAMPGQAMQMRMVDGVIYLKTEMTEGKHLALDTSDPNNPLGSAMTDQFDPRSMFRAFESSIRKVTFVGEEEVDGETTRHYRVELDSAAMTEKMGPEAGAADLPAVITYDLWLDDEGRYRQIAVDLGESAGTMRMMFSDWGEPVTIEAPPQRDVMEMPSMR